MVLILGSIFISIGLFGIAYSAVALKVMRKGAEVPPENIIDEHDSGILVKHGMVATPGKRGVRPTKSPSDYYYDSLMK